MKNTKNPNVWKSSSKLKFQNPHLLNPPLLKKRKRMIKRKKNGKRKKKQKVSVILVLGMQIRCKGELVLKP